ncbi:hypothetical protein N665_0055s0031 [Sinapis alba]|nr:hypothetical protein N665_0055s0031 [Sinapis alba]
MTPQKSMLQLSVHDERIRKKVWGTVSRFSGVSSIEMDEMTGKMKVVGEVEVSKIVWKLRKICRADIVSVEVVKPLKKKTEPEKPTEPKPVEILAYPVTQLNYPYQYYSSYANSHLSTMRGL